MRRLGHDDDACLFFDVHVVADAVHESVAAVDLAGGLAKQDPKLGADVLWGARALLEIDGRWARHMMSAWAGRRVVAATGAGAAVTEDELRAVFDAPDPLTIGLEEEVMLVDSVTLDLAPVAGELLGDGGSELKLELPASQAEIVTAPARVGRSGDRGARDGPPAARRARGLAGAPDRGPVHPLRLAARRPQPGRALRRDPR